MVKRTKNVRVPLEFLSELEGAMTERFNNKLLKKKDFHTTEGFRLLRRMPEFKLSMEKIKKVPKKEDIRRI